MKSSDRVRTFWFPCLVCVAVPPFTLTPENGLVVCMLLAMPVAAESSPVTINRNRNTELGGRY